jgi:formate dehydrogenase major subunit
LKQHATLGDYLATETDATGYWANTPKFLVSYLKSMYGAAATPENAFERKGLRQLEWLVVKDNWMTETATFWETAPEVENGEVKPADIQTEVFFFPSAQVAETEGSFTNTERMLQWHFKATDPPW